MRGTLTHQRQAGSSSNASGSTDFLLSAGCSSQDSGLGFDAAEEEHIFLVDSSNFECGSFASRSSLKLIHEVVSNLDDKKRELVRSTGFGGILHFPVLKHINRKFALWLMSCVDESTRTLVVGDHIRIRFCKEDAANVFGIPCSGKRVIDPRSCTRDAKAKVLDEYLGTKFRKGRSIKHLVEIIERVYDEPMSPTEQDCFRIAFVVFVVSTLLSPAAKHDYACIDYWCAIQDPELIRQFDWSEFVIIRLLEAVSKLKMDVGSSVKFPNISGCSVFIMVLYLDSVDLGELSIMDNLIPRIRHFSSDKIRSMIAADTNYLNYVNGNRDSPDTQLRENGSCCYYWSFESLAPADVPRSGSLLAIWESCVAMARFLGVPMEAAGPLFVAAADFQDQVDAGLAPSGLHAIKYLTVLVSIMSAYKEGFTYHFSIDDDQFKEGNVHISDHISTAIAGGLKMMSVPVCRKRKEPCSVVKAGNENLYRSRRCVRTSCEASSSDGLRSILHHSVFGDTVHSSIKAALSSIDSMRPELNVNHRLITSMSKFYSLVRRLKVPVDFDINHPLVDNFYCAHGTAHHVSHRMGNVPSPWSLGYCWSIGEVDSDEVFSRISRVRDDEGFVIVHRNPRHIQVTARSFRSQILGCSEMELDLFDAIIRKVKQDDYQLYENLSCVRWRHFFESDFMATITSGAFDLSDGNLRHHFSASNINFDISACKLLFFPAMLQYRWVCYAWCLESNVIHVFDPRYCLGAPASIMSCHERICYMLKYAMHSLVRSHFNSWEFDWIQADLSMVTWADKFVDGSNRSGVLAALFCRCFDGQDLSPSPKSVDTDIIAAKLSSDIVSLKGNIGQIPHVLLSHTLERI